jgi:hypothetical protein
MRIEFYEKDDPQKVVGTATWDGRRPRIETKDETVRATVERIFRPTPVVVDDGAFRYLGAKGEAMLQPGSVEWFREAALTRASAEELSARIVPEVDGERGWDPAAAYRTFRDSIRRLFEQEKDSVGATRRQPGESAPEDRAKTGDQPRGSAGPPTGP